MKEITNGHPPIGTGSPTSNPTPLSNRAGILFQCGAASSGEPALSFCPENGAKVRGSVSLPTFSDFHTIR